MRKNAVKVLSVCLGIALILTAFSVNAFSLAKASASEVLFSDFANGTDITKSGWKKTGSIDYLDGEIFFKSEGNLLLLNRMDSPAGWSNYTVEADMYSNGIAAGSDDSAEWTPANGVVLMGLAVGAPDSTTRYECRFKYDGSGCTVDLVKRGTTTSTPVSKDFSGFAFHTTYSLKAVVKANTISFYVDDLLYFSWTDSSVENITGTVGMLSGSARGYFDNFIVKTISEETAIAAGTEFYQDFTQLNNVYGDLTNCGWVKGSASLEKDTDTNTNTGLRFRNTGPLYLKGISGSDAWRDYTVETTMYISDKTNTNIERTGTNNYCGVFAALDSANSGLEFTVVSIAAGDCTVRLYDRAETTTNITTKVKHLNYNEAITLKMVLKGKTVYCFVNGTCVIVKTASRDLTGFAALRGDTGVSSVYNKVSFSNISITPTDMNELVNTNFDYLKAGSTLTSAQMNGAVISSNITEKNGAAYFSGSGSVYAAESFTDGSIQADVSLVKALSGLTGLEIGKQAFPVTFLAREIASTTSEARVRFMVTKQAGDLYDVALEWVFYDTALSATPIRLTILTQNGVAIGDGTVYHIKLSFVGNLLTAEINGNTYKRVCPTGTGLTAAGRFGVSTNGTVECSIDNVNIAKLDTYSVSGLSGGVSTELVNSYLKVGDINQFARNAFAAGEEVKLSITASQGTQPAAGGLKYTTASGIEKTITAKPSNIAVGVGSGSEFAFFMPKENISIAAAFLDTDQTNFNFAVVGVSAGEYGQSLRFLTRLNLPKDENNLLTTNVVYNGAQYSIADYGTLIAPQVLLNTYKTGLTADSVSKTAVSAKRVSALTDGGRLTDRTNSYFDYTAVLKEIKADYFDQLYSARAYVAIEPVGGGEMIFVYSDVCQVTVNSLF